MKERVILQGVVHGEGRKATCRIRATRVTLEAGISETAEWSILDVSERLPDGNYEIFADGKSEHARLVNGQWLSGGY